MSYTSENLLKDESILYTTQPHWIIFLSAILITIFAIASIFYFQNYVLPGYIFLAVAAFQWISAFVTYITSEYALTNQRILVKVGFIQRRSFETLLQRITSIEVSQSILARILGYGTIIIYGTGIASEIFRNVNNPIEFRKKIQQQIEIVLGKS
jgi:uncharacterized membrane protein YdbT with pleckstrin-like domain